MWVGQSKDSDYLNLLDSGQVFPARLPLRPRIAFLLISGLRSWDPKGKAEQPVRQP